ncbi:MAG: SRPBCC family protein [Cyanobacteria bacterium]|nr:SRPBCC family protein [Cyanobacteriota bacterium]
MATALSLNQFTPDLNDAEQQRLHQGEVVLNGQLGSYTVWVVVPATAATVWEVLTDYEGFPKFLPSVVSSKVTEREGNRTVVARRDRRKIGFMPIKVKIVTENIEVSHERIDYRMLSGTLDSLEGVWRLAPLDTAGDTPRTLLVQMIEAKANLGPLQSYFYQVFEKGLVDTLGNLRVEMARRAIA